jgi:N6-adenosine-specific RNA methylase IME4
MKYKTIYADPPWPERGGGKIKRGADKHYNLMTVKEIAALPIRNIADDNCHLYLWTTNNYLAQALEVMRAWGFRYVTTTTRQNWFCGTQN